MDAFSRDFHFHAAKMEIKSCDDIDVLKEKTLALLELVMGQRRMLDRVMAEQLQRDFNA